MNNLLCLIRGHAIYNDWARSPETACHLKKHRLSGGMCTCIDCGVKFCYMCSDDTVNNLCCLVHPQWICKGCNKHFCAACYTMYRWNGHTFILGTDDIYMCPIAGPCKYTYGGKEVDSLLLPLP